MAAVQKKIEELKAKTRAFEEQISNLTEKKLITEETIQQLDTRRDAEVSELLAKLGVNLGLPKEQEFNSNSNSPFAVLLPQESDSKSNDDDDDDQG